MTKAILKSPQTQPTPIRRAYSAPSVSSLQIVTLTVEQLEALITEAIDRAVERYTEGARQPAAVLTADQLCEALQISRPTLRKLEAEGLPSLPVGDHRRYVLAESIAWMRDQEVSHG